MTCEHHNVQVAKLENLEHKLEADIEDLTDKIADHDISINNMRKIILGNGVEGMTVRMRTMEKDIEGLMKGLDKIQQTMTYISRTAWGIILLVVVNAVYWASRVLVTHG